MFVMTVLRTCKVSHWGTVALHLHALHAIFGLAFYPPD